METLYFIFKQLRERYHFEIEEILDVFFLFKCTRVQKGQEFIVKGKAKNIIAILTEGLMLSEYTDMPGKKHVKNFFIPPSAINNLAQLNDIHTSVRNILMVNFDCFIKKIPSNETITALEKCSLMTMSETVYREIFIKMPKISMILADVLEEIVLETEERNHDLQMLKSKERVKKFIHKFPGLFNRANKMHIASYLGLSRNQLTRIMKQIK